MDDRAATLYAALRAALERGDRDAAVRMLRRASPDDLSAMMRQVDADLAGIESVADMSRTKATRPPISQRPLPGAGGSPSC